MRRPHEPQPLVPFRPRRSPPLALRATPSGTGSKRRGRNACCPSAGHPGQRHSRWPLGNGPRWGPRLRPPTLLCDVKNMSINNKIVSNANQDVKWMLNVGCWMLNVEPHPITFNPSTGRVLRRNEPNHVSDEGSGFPPSPQGLRRAGRVQADRSSDGYRRSPRDL